MMTAISPVQDGKNGSGQSGGFVTVAVLIGLSIAAAILTNALADSRFSGEALAAVERQTVDQASVRSAIRRLFAGIENPSGDPETDTLPIPGSLSLAVPGANALLELEAEAGKINLFTADPVLAASYLAKASGLPPASLNTALSKGRAHFDAGRRAEAMAEIEGLLLKTLTYTEVMRDITVAHVSTGVDPIYASLRLLESVPGIGGRAESILTQRQENPAAVRAMSPYFVEIRSNFRVVASKETAAGTTQKQALSFGITSAGKIKPIGGFLYP
jgi:hypothetical protein